VGYGLFTVEASPSLSGTLHSVGIPRIVFSLSQRILPLSSHKRQTSMLPRWDSTAVPGSKRLQAHTLETKNIALYFKYICFYSDINNYIIVIFCPSF